MAFCGEVALEEAMGLSYDRVQNEGQLFTLGRNLWKYRNFYK
jgi:DNA-directed RNA polymerase delta subunit